MACRCIGVQISVMSHLSGSRTIMFTPAEEAAVLSWELYSPEYVTCVVCDVPTVNTLPSRAAAAVGLLWTFKFVSPQQQQLWGSFLWSQTHDVKCDKSHLKGVKWSVNEMRHHHASAETFSAVRACLTVGVLWKSSWFEMLLCCILSHDASPLFTMFTDKETTDHQCDDCDLATVWLKQ